MGGLFYRQNDKTICYANAYLPNVWQKWRGIADEGYLVSGIISADVAQDKPLYQQKEDFLHYLESVAEEFFSFWQSLWSKGAVFRRQRFLHSAFVTVRWFLLTIL